MKFENKFQTNEFYGFEVSDFDFAAQNRRKTSTKKINFQTNEFYGYEVSDFDFAAQNRRKTSTKKIKFSNVSPARVSRVIGMICQNSPRMNRDAQSRP